ncbi:PAS domain S-box protein [Desulfosporosinus sp. Sb-LF]|uniref:PAS domain S-box protein n=1 Tax=Desulfosporosinus sp. Sb-LF TaxID=2560027 RepID=UPI00107F4C6A|nr:PAS domain S-box protein [Desulfosporosinus sp. Sb-LF]TGE33661.1 PAS domain S-box protein [Desulfosporosinus sp. Sb-LF]
MSNEEVIVDFGQELALVNFQEDKEIWDRIFTENPWGIAVSDAISGELLKVNPRYTDMHGYCAEELLGRSMYGLLCASGHHDDIQRIYHKVHDKGHYEYNSIHVRKDGSCFPVHIDNYELTVSDRCLRVVSIWDITESEQKENELRRYRESLEELVELRTAELLRTNEQLRDEIIQRETAENELAIVNQELSNTLESISDGFLAVNRQWIITHANKAMVKANEANGFNGNLVGTNFWDIYDQGNKLITNSCLKVMNDGQPTRFESNEPFMGFWLEISIYPTENGISIFFRDIDERKEIEKAVEEEHLRLYSLFDGFPGLIYVQEENYKIRYANRNFQTKFGSWEGRSCYEVIGGLLYPCIDCETPMTFRNTTSLWKEVMFDNRVYEVYAQPYTDVDGSKLIFKVLIDITDRKNADRELARMERLNMVGEMAAGIAHEVRNPLTTVRGFLQLLGSKDTTKNNHKFYELMIQELDRANVIISDFLSLAREKSTDFGLINITEIVRNLSPLLSADAINQDKRLNLELEPVTNIQGNANEIRQLLLNLAKNGLEAMQGGTTLTIQAHEVGNHIILRICDQGGGVDPAILKKLGTPFLTTKERGTGLGIAICQSIALRQNAVMSFESSPTGTTVTVEFAGDNGENSEISNSKPYTPGLCL